VAKTLAYYDTAQVTAIKKFNSTSPSVSLYWMLWRWHPTRSL